MAELSGRGANGRHVREPESPMSKSTSDSRLILITEGRTSGRSEAALLEYRRVGNDYLVIARNSKGRIKPDWYLNLKHEANVRVEISDASFPAKAWTPTGADRVRLLPFVRDMGAEDVVIPRQTAAILLSPVS